MIKNIVFDLGGVLIDFKPERYLAHIGFSEEDITLFTKIVFYGKQWNEYNSSKLNVKQTEQELIQSYPQYNDKLKRIFDNINYEYILFEMKDTSNYLKELKDKGYNIYILSDLNIDSYNYNKQFNFFDYITGGVYSFEIGTTKPNKNNYKVLLEKYNLIPEETIFIDDRLNNIQVANDLGIFGIQFVTLDIVKDEIKKLEKRTKRVKSVQL